MAEEIRFLASLIKAHKEAEGREREHLVYHLGKALEHYRAGGPPGDMHSSSIREAIRYERDLCGAVAKRKALEELRDLQEEA